METDKPKSRLPKQKQFDFSPFAKFSGLAIQMGVTIYLGNLLGEFLDEKYNNTSGLYAKIVTLTAVFLSIYLVIVQVTRTNSDS